MPGGDRTGPNGMGPMSGRQAGYCAGYAVPGSMNLSGGYMGRGGRGLGGGAGFGGRGRRQRFNATGWSRWGRGDAPAIDPAFAASQAAAAPDEEVVFLKNQIQGIKDTLERLEARLTALQSATGGSEHGENVG